MIIRLRYILVMVEFITTLQSNPITIDAIFNNGSYIILCIFLLSDWIYLEDTFEMAKFNYALSIM